MLAPQDNRQAVAEARARSRSRAIAGVALMLLGVAVMAYGAHYVTKNGNCSGTGYTSYGPVAKCSGGEALYITSVFFLGPALAVVGWLLAGVSGVLWPAFCIAMAVGLITLREETALSAGAKAFGVVIGEVVIVLALVSVIVSVRKRRRPKAAPAGIAGTGTVLPEQPGSPRRPGWPRRAPGPRRARQGPAALARRGRLPDRIRSTRSPNSPGCATAARSPTRSTNARRPCSSASCDRADLTGGPRSS